MDLKDIKSKIVLSTIISKHIKLIKKNYLYWGNCIFHKEKTPSFAVNDEKEYYHCFGCGSHGDVFSFLMEVSKKPFHQILEELCDIYKIPYKKHLEYQPQNKVQEILLESMELYKGFLEKNLEVKNFLLKRGITQEYIDKFQLGYAPQNGTIIQLLKIHSITSLKDAGLVSMGSYDRLRNRIIFPILNEKNKPIAFAGRSLSNEKPKYINSNETLLFHKNLCLYNINNLPMQVEEIFLVEGYIDVITMTRCGFVNTVASMGTSVSKSQLFILLRRTRKLYLLFDGDEGGKMASQRTINLLLEMLIPGYSIQIGLLPQEEDPDSYLSKYDVNSLKNYFKDIVDILMDYIIKDLNLDKVEDLSSAFNRMNIYINLINNESVKSSYKIILEKRLKKAHSQLSYEMKNSSGKNINKKYTKDKIFIQPYVPSVEENIISIILYYPDILCDFVESLSVLAFKNLELEKMKNNLILHAGGEEFFNIINEYQNNLKIKKLLNYNQVLLSKKDFCRKYLWDLLCLIPIDNNNPKLF